MCWESETGRRFLNVVSTPSWLCETWVEGCGLLWEGAMEFHCFLIGLSEHIQWGLNVTSRKPVLSSHRWGVKCYLRHMVGQPPHSSFSAVWVSNSFNIDKIIMYLVKRRSWTLRWNFCLRLRVKFVKRVCSHARFAYLSLTAKCHDFSAFRK